MRIFLIWSGSTSKLIAHMLKVSLPNIIQAIEVFYSEESIEKGSFWRDKIIEEIDKCDHAIVCLTSENFNSRWINFEAGMIYKRFKNVSIINFDLGDKIEEPLSMFQDTKLIKEDFFNFVKELNAKIEKPLTDTQLIRAFDNEWGEMEKQISDITDSFPNGSCKRNEDNNSIEEVKKLLEEKYIILDSKLSKLSFDNLEFEFRKDDEKIFITTNGNKREVQGEQNYYK